MTDVVQLDARDVASRCTVSTSPMKVLHVINSFSLGGAETNLLNLVRAFNSARVETHVAYAFGGEIEPRFRDAGVRLFKYSNVAHPIKSLRTPLVILRLAAYIRRHRIDIVHSHNFNGHVWGLLAAKLCGVKVVEHVHDFRYTPAAELARRHHLLSQYKYIRYFRRMSDRIVVLTRDNADYVVRTGISDAARVVEIPNGIELPAPVAPAENLRERFGIAPDRFVVMTSARMFPPKNIDLIPRIAAAVAREVPKVLFVLVGSGSHLEQYQQQTAELGVQEHILFAGFQQDVDGMLSMADVFLLPSLLELHSIAILEALRKGLPVVVSSGVGCNDEFIDNGVNGFLCDPFMDAPWVEALVRLGKDDTLRRTIGARGRETCERLFNIPDTAARFEGLYRGLVQ